MRRPRSRTLNYSVHMGDLPRNPQSHMQDFVFIPYTIIYGVTIGTHVTIDIDASIHDSVRRCRTKVFIPSYLGIVVLAAYA